MTLAAEWQQEAGWEAGWVEESPRDQGRLPCEEI